jgi:hypothetical protein
LFRFLALGFLLFFLSGFQSVQGQTGNEPTPAVTAQTPSPIDIQRASLWGLVNLQIYSQKGDLIPNPDLMEKVGGPRDEEISRLLQTSQTSSDLGQWCDGIGLGGGAVGAGFLLAGSNDSGTSNIGVGFLLGGLGLKLAGTLLTDEANSSLFNAVERYNRIYWEETGDFPSTKYAKGLNPIHTHFSTLNGFEYECAGKRLGGSEDFKPLFDASNDHEVTRLFDDSQGAGTTGTILEVTGGAGCLGTAVGYLSASNSGDKTAYAWGFASSAVVALVGDLFLKGAESSKFNAVQRYNRFARGQEAVLPSGPENEKDLLNFGAPAPQVAPNSPQAAPKPQ